ncbi:MAG: FtsX-like permease family protein, partial [Candidatus Latescibacteria bacterium]|nr:FtsX-like permease family protein [Candidatus Latescibacterota bacterium]
PFNETDLTEGEPVVIVNETFATTYWPGENAIGKRVQIHDTDEPFRTIVGVASNGKYRSLGEQPRSFLYEPYSQETFSFAHLAVRTSIDGRELLLPVRNEIKAIDRHLPILDIITVREHLELMLFLPRALASILAGLGLLSLILGTTGLYGVIAYDVSRRTREVGIRLSVGAQQSQVLRLIMLDGLKLVGVGTIIGLGLAFLLTRLLGSMLFNISPADPITFAGVTVLFVVVTIAATLNPARKASTVNPVEALRTE